MTLGVHLQREGLEGKRFINAHVLTKFSTFAFLQTFRNHVYLREEIHPNYCYDSGILALTITVTKTFKARVF